MRSLALVAASAAAVQLVKDRAGVRSHGPRHQDLDRTEAAAGAGEQPPECAPPRTVTGMPADSSAAAKIDPLTPSGGAATTTSSGSPLTRRRPHALAPASRLRGERPGEELAGVRASARPATSSGVPSATTSPPSLAALGAEVDDPVGGLDHVQVVLDDDHGVALRRRGAAAPRAASRCRRSAGRWWARRGCRACGRWRTLVSSVASLTRCASPPESVVAGWPSLM